MEAQDLHISIRPMALADVTRVREIDVRSFSMPWSERSYRFELTENNHSVIWVAEVDGVSEGTPSPEGTPSDKVAADRQVVGMIVVWAIVDEAHIATIAVDPQYRGRGLGRRLLAVGLRAAYQRGARLAYLEVRRGNLVAQNLYQQFGFRVAGERPRYYQDNNEDALLMTLDQLDPEALERFAV